MEVRGCKLTWNSNSGKVVLVSMASLPRSWVHSPGSASLADIFCCTLHDFIEKQLQYSEFSKVTLSVKI